VKCRAEAVVAVRAGDAVNLAIPIEVSNAIQALPDDGFLVIDLFVVTDVLPMAASFGVVVWSVWLLPVG